MNETTITPRVIELPRPEKVPCPYEDTYETDVLVIGCGFAGLNAAVSAKLGGASVLVMDKGRPGYSGLSPWPSSFRWFDPDRGDKEEAYIRAMMEGGDYIANLNWYRRWLEESKGIYERLTDWGILAQYPKAAEAGDFYEKEDFWGYRATYDRLDRHKKWIATLDRYDIPYLEHTMAADLLTVEGAACGAIGLHVPSGKFITVRAKAVVLATGGGSYKPTGYPVGRSDLAGAATGMCCHLTSGVFNGFEATNDVPEIPGLFVAGDGTHATAPSGSAYPCGVGFTSCFCSIDGDHAGRAAAEYVEGKDRKAVSEEDIDAKLEVLSAPLTREKGFDPNWARDVLHSIMAPYWVSVTKTEPTLQAALTQVEYMRDHVAPRLCARSGHDLRLCLEVQHKILSAEIKLRAGLFRAESRGTHYRADIPYRVDSEYLCYVTVQKSDEGMALKKQPVPAEWTGDVSAAYTDRYHYYFPGEPEAKGFEAPKSTWGGKKGAK